MRHCSVVFVQKPGMWLRAATQVLTQNMDAVMHGYCKCWCAHDANAEPSHICRLLGRGLSACPDVKHAGCGLWNIFRLLYRKTLFIVECRQEVWQKKRIRIVHAVR